MLRTVTENAENK